MDIKSFRKETSERSEHQNWVLEELSGSSVLYFTGFEGCNENSSFQATAILDRSLIDVSGSIDDPPPIEQVIALIESNEGRALQGKINFCSHLGFPYTYVLYNYEHHFVLRYELTDKIPVLREKYISFETFSQWIQSIKQWESYKWFRENPDLPVFDKALREAGCAWPTNIDCVAFNNDHQPVALIEFQNAKKTGVRNHSNIYYFLPVKGYYGGFKKGPDEQRWRSQEILRVQSGLPHLTIVWSQEEDFVIVKRLEKVVFPDYSDEKKSQTYVQALAMMNIAIQGKQKDVINQCLQSIGNKYSSYYLSNVDGKVSIVPVNPPLSFTERTFPFIYGHRYPEMIKGDVKSEIEKLLIEH